MKYLVVFLCATVMAANIHGAEQTEMLKDETAKINYSVGYQIGDDFKQQEIEIRSEAILKGIQDALSDSGSLMTSQEMRSTMAELGKHVAGLKQKNKQALLARLEQNKKFLQENAKKPGVTTTASGLQYRVIEQGGAGGGKSPKLNNKVLVQYTGKLLDGTVFDSSRGKPVSLPVSRVISGWQEALQLMRRGDHWQLYIPSDLAYGKRGAGEKIPPDSALIFDVELISIQ